MEEAHWASCFRPRELPGLHNGLVDAAEMIIRGVHLWRQTRWPGRNGRVRYAHTLFNLYVIRCLALLSLRLWDGRSSSAGDRLSQVQGVLDQLCTTVPADLVPLLEVYENAWHSEDDRVAEQAAASSAKGRPGCKLAAPHFGAREDEVRETSPGPGTLGQPRRPTDLVAAAR